MKITKYVLEGTVKYENLPLFLAEYFIFAHYLLFSSKYTKNLKCLIFWKNYVFLGNIVGFFTLKGQSHQIRLV